MRNKKRYKLYKQLLFLAFLFGIADNAISQDISENLKFHYEFLSLDENGMIPNHANPTLTEAAKKFGKATIENSDFKDGKSLRLYNLNGNNVANPAVDYLLLPNNLTAGLTDFTISLWIKPEASDTWARIFDFGKGTNINMFLTTNAGGSGLRFAFKNTDIISSEYQIDNRYGFLAPNEWSHVAITGKYTITNNQVIHGELKLYLNGEDVGYRRDNLGEVKITPASLGYTSQNYIGKSQYNDNGLRGSLNDFRIYNKALSRDEIQTIRISGRLLDYYNELNEEIIKGNNTALNYVINPLHLPFLSDDELISITWSSSNENIILPDGSINRPENTEEITISAKIEYGNNNITKNFLVTVIGTNQDPSQGENPNPKNYQLKINELMSNNVSAVMDDGYNYSMWVEVYNQGNEAVNLSMFYFSDKKSNKKKWRPEGKIIKPGDYHVIWFEREEYDKHASFKLAPEGGKLFIYDLPGNLVDDVTYPLQYRNVSYGRINDGDGNWAFFPDYSFNSTNNGKQYVSAQCSHPIFTVPGGLYNTNQNIGFKKQPGGENIYFTTDGTEPTQNSRKYTPGTTIAVSNTTIIRARTFAENKMPSNIISASYIFDNAIDLAVVSIITDPKNLYDNTIGIYTEGTNGIPGKGQSDPRNWNQDWSRPANFELFNIDGNACLNQELDIAISGGWTRANAQKSLKISPRKKFGDNRLRYDIFSATKPDRKYKDIQLRNSGNDWNLTMMRDAFMQSLIINRIDLDYQAYEPAILFLNGTYFGIQNLRERTSKDYLYSNYGLDEDDFYLLEGSVDTDDITNHPEFSTMSSYILNSNVSESGIYENIKGMMDIDNMIGYFLAQIYYGNTDWPHNNVKVWKEIKNGKWRWILFDTDFGFNLSSSIDHNTLTNALDSEATCAKIFNRLINDNKAFQDKFIDFASIHLSSTFHPVRTIQIMDSISGKIENQIIRHKNRWGHNQNFNYLINNMKSFANQRPDYMLKYISDQFLNSSSIKTIGISSNIQNAHYFFNDEKIIDNRIDLKSFQGRTIKIEAGDIEGYTFKHWEINNKRNTISVISHKENWNFFDENKVPGSDWTKVSFNDNAWKKGNAPLGYGGLGHTTSINYGSNSSNKYPAAYFRKKVTINNLAAKEQFEITILADDGAVVYLNGQEVGRTNMPNGTILHSSYASGCNNGEYTTFSVSKNILKEGENQLAVEVHQCNASSSDLIMDMEMTCHESISGSNEIWENPVYEGILKDNFSIKAVYGDPSSSISAPKLNDSFINLYPEIIDDHFIVENASGMIVRIINTSGMTLLETKCYSDKEEIKLNNIRKGIYIVMIGNKSFKIIKK